MPIVSTDCIYCPNSFDPTKGEGDHVLSKSLFGEFRGDRRFRGACPPCNNQFGRYEEELIHASPLGLLRQIVQPNLHKFAQGRSRRQRGAAGTLPPKVTAQFEGHTLLVNPSESSPTDVEGVDQVIIEDSDGALRRIQLFSGMSADSLRKKIERAGVKGLKQAWFWCDPKDAEHFKRVLASVFPTARSTEEGITQGTKCRVPIQFVGQVTIRYAQALAKIAFHYYLVHNRRGFRGNEPHFAAIRDFIKNGGQPESFFHSSNRSFALPHGQRLGGLISVPAGWYHLLAVDEAYKVIVVCLFLFVGPRHLPKPVYVTVGSLPGSIIHPNGVWAHQYNYDVNPTGRYAGAVSEAPPIRLRRPAV